MFKSAATKIAHNSTLPALAGNKDLRPLQDLITAEKSIVQTLLKLSSDFAKASEALRSWGLGEGDDLGDVLNGSTSILSHFSSALSKFASHEQAIREHMKAVRSREEALDALRHRRKNVVSKADSAEKKLNKMSPEHKNIQVQTDALNRLQDEIRQLDSEIMTEEARLGDFKRTSTKTWMSLKFGGLQECCEKGVIVGNAGKIIIAEIPQDETIPGTPRAFYTGHPRTEAAVAETAQLINEVVFSATPSAERPRTHDRPSSHEFSADAGPFSDPNTLSDTGTFLRNEASSINTDFSGMPQPDTSFRPGITTSNLQVNELGALSPQSDVPRMHTFSSAPSLPPLSDDSAPSSAMPGSRSGGQFATFPVKGGRSNLGYSNDLGKDTSFSKEVAEALNQGGSSAEQQVPRVSYDDPVPTYEAVVQPPNSYPSGETPSDQPMENPYVGTDQQQEDESQLPWMEPSRAERRVRFGSRPIEIGTPVLARFRNEGPPSANTEDGAYTQPMASPPPSGNPVPQESTGNQDAEDERALNAAAAREVSRELDALSFNSFSSPPPPPPPLLAHEASSPAPLSIPTVSDVHAPSQTNTVSPNHPVSPYTRERHRDSGSPTPSSRSPVESISNQIPPVRATSPPGSPNTRGPLPPPPAISLPESTPPSSFSVGTPYRTPPEYPNTSAGGTSPAISPSPSFSKPPTSIIGTSPSASPSPSFSRPIVAPPPPPSGVRTISAAAFRRPQNRRPSDGSLGPGGAVVADTSPLSVRKRGLPSSPYATRVAGGFGSTSSIPQVQSPPAQQQRSVSPPALDEHEDFDYISAYVNSGDGSEDETRARSGSNGGLR